jgi:alpha-amylase
MTDVCLCFEVHQPFRLRKDFFWERKMFKHDVDLFDYYFSDDNNAIFDKITNKCYLPANEILLNAIDEFKGRFKVTFSLSGVFVEQCERYHPDVLDSFKQLAETKRVEFLDQTYYHSLASLYDDPGEFIHQIKMHRELMKDLFGYSPKVFENTELLYNNRIADIAAQMGYRGIFTEGTERIQKNPNYLYRARNADIKVLLRNYKLTDDIAFRFSSRWWEEYPLTADKYASWLSSTPGDCINIFADYETFGEHHWVETGIFEFLRHLPGEVLKWENLSFATPSEVVERYPARDEIDVFEMGGTVSWADLERDTSCWLGNTMQWASFHYHKDMRPRILDENLLEIWHYLGSSDHLYYMFTAGGGPGEVHSYFSHFNTPYDAFITYMGVLFDLDARIREDIIQANEPFAFSLGKGKFVKTVYGMKDFIQALESVDIESIKYHAKRGDFEKWARHSLKDPFLADQLKNIKLAGYEEGGLRDEIRKAFERRYREIKSTSCK